MSPQDADAVSVDALLAQLDALRAQVNQAREKHRAAGRMGRRPCKVPATALLELAALVARGNSPRDARSVLRRKYGVTSQGFCKALRRIERQEANLK